MGSVPPWDRFIILWNLPCPYKNECNKNCSKRGIEVVECKYYQMYSQEELEKLVKLIREFLKNGKQHG
ncbi:MAG: hypothetical protein DRO40_09800 [Thermoprotei archaeon]|nr:MAG: hypothetical protein DRO40_09800 [Thermoprotei archaeon]